MTSVITPPAPSPTPPFPELFRDEVLRLETHRLWLRWPTAADASALHEIASLEAVARHTATWPHPFPDGEALRRIERARQANAEGIALQLALTEKARPGRLIGLIGVGPTANDGPTSNSEALELGYLLAIEHQGFGIMTEAVRALVGTVFAFTAFDRIRGTSGLANLASRRVMEKSGFAHLGKVSHAAPARGATVECDALQLTRAAWRGRPSVRPAGSVRAGATAENELRCGPVA